MADGVEASDYSWPGRLLMPPAFFDLAHAVSNVLLGMLFFPSMIVILEDYQQGLQHSYIDESAV